ncbi:hypothetical protein OAV88_01070 [bacterium]|nr:hypothetical protein [bacterium]
MSALQIKEKKKIITSSSTTHISKAPIGFDPIAWEALSDEVYYPPTHTRTPNITHTHIHTHRQDAS